MLGRKSIVDRHDVHAGGPGHRGVQHAVDLWCAQAVHASVKVKDGDIGARLLGCTDAFDGHSTDTLLGDGVGEIKYLVDGAPERMRYFTQRVDIPGVGPVGWVLEYVRVP